MQAYHPGTGMTLEFPDNTPDEAIQQHFLNAQASLPTNAPSVAQQFLDGPRSAMDQQQAAPAPLSGRGFVGLDPQQAQFMLQQRQNQAAMQQQAASDAARNRLQQQQLMQQGLEGEKDRSLQINLHKQTLKNHMDERKIWADQMEHELEWKTKLAMLKEAGATERELAKLRKPISVSDGGALVDPETGMETYKNPKTYAPNKLREITGSDFSIEDVYDPASGSSNKYSVNKITGERTLIGPAPPMASRGKFGTDSAYRHPTVSDSIKISERINSDFLKAKSDAEAKARAASGDPNAPVQIDEPALREEVARKVRRELGVSAFPDKESAKQFMDMQAEQFYNQAAAAFPKEQFTPEMAQRLQVRASNMAQVERWKADGYVAYIDPQTGEAVVKTDDGKEPGT